MNNITFRVDEHFPSARFPIFSNSVSIFLSLMQSTMLSLIKESKQFMQIEQILLLFSWQNMNSS